MDSSSTVVQMLQTCKLYFSVPMGVDCIELIHKIDNLNKLHMMWTEDCLEDCSYQSEVYKRICEIFSNNVFRPTLYTYEDEINSEMLWEFKQLYPVYKMLIAFLNLKAFDDEKLSPYVGCTFIKALIQRLQDSCVEVERDCVKQILFRLFEKSVYLREYILQNTINSLVGVCGQIMATYGSVKELLELLKIEMCYGLVDSPTIAMVLTPLIKRNELCHFAGQLHECFETAARKVDVGLSVRFVGDAIDNWSSAAADVPTLCRTLAALYFDVCDDESRSRVRGRVVGHVAGCLLTSVAAAAAADGDGASSAACRAYVDFTGLLIDDVSTAGAGAAGGLDRMAGALVAVHRTNRGNDCVDVTGRLIRRLIGVNDGRCLVGDGIRVAVMEVLLAEE
ncbi:Protein phosphatase 2A, regulatory B subunit, B56,Armadillo-type fold [Cinara cedri]|uniref:Protein phosphatase 2A, regulatory B subunit, B56,Armadillo-type fold n=1 Tax=Cinara cedri TaxID=506608 RepID=A0A5E4NBX3_9HEMI|nr:Protein phosphatase 2A, regulatory B subunit, B56,Armadillo-type fold [Cinara cedri]